MQAAILTRGVIYSPNGPKAFRQYRWYDRQDNANYYKSHLIAFQGKIVASCLVRFLPKPFRFRNETCVKPIA